MNRRDEKLSTSSSLTSSEMIKAQGRYDVRPRYAFSPEERRVVGHRMSTRLYVGNLSQGVDEYVIAELFSKHGKISRLDYLFHKSGPLKGQPRGFAFVEYKSKQEAEAAIKNLNGKLVRGKQIRVSHASEQAEHEQSSSNASSALTGRGALRRGANNDTMKPTTISLLKQRTVTSNNSSTDKKIAALEAKLAAMQRQKKPAEPVAILTSTSTIDAKAAGLPARPYFDAPPAEQTKRM